LEAESYAWGTGDGRWGLVGTDVDKLEALDLFEDVELWVGLWVDGSDYSTEFTRCVQASGYIAPRLWTNPAVELKEKTAVIEASIEWARCARANGFPGLADPAPAVADNYATSPMVMLPADTSVVQVEALVAACGSLNEWGKRAFEEGLDPAIAPFSVPAVGFEDNDDDSGTVSPERQALIEERNRALAGN
jgi:hypothetical protein